MSDPWQEYLHKPHNISTEFLDKFGQDIEGLKLIDKLKAFTYYVSHQTDFATKDFIRQAKIIDIPQGTNHFSDAFLVRYGHLLGDSLLAILKSYYVATFCSYQFPVEKYVRKMNGKEVDSDQGGV